MNDLIQRIAKVLDHRRIAILGLGISNRPLLHFLSRFDVELAAFDMMDEHSSQAQALKKEFSEVKCPLQFYLGADYLKSLKSFDLIFRTPRIRPDEEHLLQACRRGAVLTSEMEFFMQFCPARMTAITGSDGKTTSSTLCARLLEAGGKKVWLGGNIGQPLLAEIEQIQPEDEVVLELSSFQLFGMQISPQTAVFTNISPNHLDVHKDFEEYFEAKRNIFSHQHLGDRLILNGEDPHLARWGEQLRSELIWAVKRPFGEQPAYLLEGDHLFYQERGPEGSKTALLSRADIRVPGRYNAMNFCLAAAACHGHFERQDLLQLARAFPGVEHRTEWIRQLDGVDYYNSSIDSSPLRSRNTLSAFGEQGRPVILISGGKDKNCDYRGLGTTIAQTCRQVFLYGDNQDLIAASIRQESGARAPAIHFCNDYREALQAARIAARRGEAVLLSPAGTSFDHFANFMERGRLFKELVKELV